MRGFCLRRVFCEIIGAQVLPNFARFLPEEGFGQNLGEQDLPDFARFVPEVPEALGETDSAIQTR